MARFENKQGIERITMKPKVICFCPLGSAFYTNQFEITVKPGKVIPDYCEVDSCVKENIAGKTLTIEDSVNNVLQYLVDEYKPLQVFISSKVEDAAHFPVEVEKEYFKEN